MISGRSIYGFGGNTSASYMFKEFIIRIYSRVEAYVVFVLKNCQCIHVLTIFDITYATSLYMGLENRTHSII